MLQISDVLFPVQLVCVLFRATGPVGCSTPDMPERVKEEALEISQISANVKLKLLDVLDEGVD